MQDNIITHKGRNTLILGPGAGVLLTALKESNTISGAIDTTVQESCSIKASALTGADTAAVIRKIVESGAGLTINIEGRESDNPLLNSILAVAKLHGSVVKMDGMDTDPEVSTEGLFDFVTGIFGKKKKKDLEEREIPNWEWISDNVKNGKLRDGLEIVGGTFAIPSRNARVMYRKGEQVKDVYKEFQADLGELEKLYATRSKPILKANKLLLAFEQDIDSLPNGVSWEKLKSVMLKYKDKLPPSDVSSFKEPSYAFLGNGNLSFTANMHGHKGYRSESGYKEGKAVANFEVSKEEVIQLLKLQAELTTFSASIQTDVGSDFIGSSIDASDPPFRGYMDEINSDPEALKVLDFFHYGVFDANFTGLISNINDRVDFLSDTIWYIVRKSVKPIDVSTESLSIEDINDLAVVANLTDSITLRKVPSGEGIDYIILIPTEDAIKEGMIAYAEALETIKDSPHLVVLPQLGEISEITAALTEYVIQNDGFVTDDPETFQVLSHEVEVSSESFKDIVSKVIDFFKPLPADHVKKVTKKLKRSFYWGADIGKQNELILNFLDNYLENPEWMSQQGFKQGRITSAELSYLTHAGTLKLESLPKDISESVKNSNQMNKDFEEEALIYLKALNKKIPYVDTALVAATYLPDDSKAFEIAVAVAINTLERITKPQQTMNFKSYPMLGYVTSRELTRFPDPLSMKISEPCLTEANFKEATKALRALTEAEVYSLDTDQFVLRGLSPVVVRRLSEVEIGEELLEYVSETGFYRYSGFAELPDIFTLRYRTILGLLTLILGSLDIKNPRL